MGESLKALRLKRGLTQAHVAELVGLSRPAYTHIERGTKKPSLSVAMKLAQLYGVDVTQLFGYLFGKESSTEP